MLDDIKNGDVIYNVKKMGNIDVYNRFIINIEKGTHYTSMNTKIRVYTILCVSLPNQRLKYYDELKLKEYFISQSEYREIKLNKLLC